MPKWHYNVDKPLVIRPRKWTDIFVCNKHFADSSLCLISTKEGGVVSLRNTTVAVDLMIYVNTEKVMCYKRKRMRAA